MIYWDITQYQKIILGVVATNHNLLQLSAGGGVLEKKAFSL